MKDEGPCDVWDVDLPYKVATFANDQRWYIRAAFATKPLAEAYASGMATAGVKAKVLWDDPGAKAVSNQS